MGSHRLSMSSGSSFLQAQVHKLPLDKIQLMPYNTSMKRAEHIRNMMIPERVRLRAEQSGPQTRQWLKDLPGLLAELEQAWELSIGQPLSGGSSAYVAPVITASGNAIIKIDMPSP